MILIHQAFGVLGWWFEGGGGGEFVLVVAFIVLPYDVGAEM